jgi:hypothetical protein
VVQGVPLQVGPKRVVGSVLRLVLAHLKIAWAPPFGRKAKIASLWRNTWGSGSSGEVFFACIFDPRCDRRNGRGGEGRYYPGGPTVDLQAA